VSSTGPGRTSELHGYWELPEISLAFDPTDRTQTAVNPLVGLRDFGPFSRRALSGTDPAIRVALLAPAPDLAALRKQLNELVHEHEPRERPAYLPAWPGFRQVFDARLGPAHESAQLAISADLDNELKASPHPHRHLAHTLGEGLRRLRLVRDRFDVVVFYLPPRYRSLFENREEGFDLHDSVKAVGAQLGLPTQIITRDALAYRCRASVAWRLGTALYAKGGGTPWKLDTTQAPLDPETVYIGISYALRPSADRATTFVTCCSQVFDSDGGGMEFVAYDVGQGTDLRNPFLTRSDMRLVMSRSLTLYQDRHYGHTPRRLVVHKKTPFTADETAGCMDAWGASSALECVSITRSSWRGLTLDAPRRRDERAVPGYAMQRGTSFQLDDRSVLVWVAGNAPEATLTGKTNYLQGGKGTPRPLLLTRDAGAGPLTETAAQVLALSKMDWNNDALYDSDPCTLRYADVLARTIKHIPDLAPVPYDYRLFM
jgi:hypothetical protein